MEARPLLEDSSQGFRQLWLEGLQGPGALPMPLAHSSEQLEGPCTSSQKQAEAPQVPWALLDPLPLVAPKAQPLAQLVLAQVLPLWLQQVP